MLIDQERRFVSQRETPSLAQCRIQLANDGWLVRFAHFQASLILPFEPMTGTPISVRIWDDEVDAITGWNDCDNFFSQALGREVRLVFFPMQTQRLVDPRYAAQPHYTFFSDGYPLLILGSASLDLLNSQLNDPLDWDRFRPNVVVQTDLAHAEDDWKKLKHPSFELELVKPCARCVVTTIDQRTGVSGKEPLRTLARYRQRDNKIYFGMNTVIAEVAPGTQVKVGDQLDPHSAL